MVWRTRGLYYMIRLHHLCALAVRACPVQRAEARRLRAARRRTVLRPPDHGLPAGHQHAVRAGCGGTQHAGWAQPHGAVIRGTVLSDACDVFGPPSQITSSAWPAAPAIFTLFTVLVLLSTGRPPHPSCAYGPHGALHLLAHGCPQMEEGRQRICRGTQGVRRARGRRGDGVT
jgi:hypothetical protein